MANNAIFEKDKKEGYEIKIKITPRNIERAFFILIILVLAYFAFWGKTADCNTNKTTEKTTGTTTTETLKTTDTEKTTTANKTVQPTPKEEEKPAVIEEKPAINTTNTTTQTNTTNTTTPAPKPKTYNGMINLTVGAIESETGEYESSGVQWGKINKVTFIIDNQKEAFTPKIQIYTYNMASSTIMKNMVRGEIIYSPQQLGEKKEHSLEISSQPFTDDDIEKVVFVKVVLKDQSTDKIIQTVEKQYNFP